MKQLLKAWIVGLVLSFIWVPSVMARHGVYSGEAIQIINQAKEILLINGYGNCGKNDACFTDADDSSIGASFYRVNDANTINQLMALYTSVYFQHKQQVDIEVTFDRISHKEDRWYKKPYITLKLKGVEK